ncbi:EamA family transporter [Radiobacillus kanasensis]|uniref:DMT family transporter n=1 Tax=Radiobacillus kanasensis TaxID=2844358 RepID=UPI001E32406D|nr:EamA family transporter [Radiobacillus kanasensis]UFU00653.1 EamA family transporter [Radiobacillus kanasensis]
MIFIQYVIMCFIFGTTFLAIKLGVDSGAPPFLSAGLRFFVAGLVLYIFMLILKKATWRLFFKKELFLTGIGLTFGTFSSLYWAEQYVSSGMASILSATGPMMIMCMQFFILREVLSKRSWYGILIGFLGVISLLSSSFTIHANWMILFGSLVILIGELFYAGGALYSKTVSRKWQNISPIALNAVQMIHGGLLLFLLSALTERTGVKSVLSIDTLLPLLYLTVVGSMVGHSLFYWLVSKTDPVFPSTWLYISPIIAVVIGAIFNGETITVWMAIGILMIISGTITVNWEALKGMVSKIRLSNLKRKVS